MDVDDDDVQEDDDDDVQEDDDEEDPEGEDADETLEENKPVEEILEDQQGIIIIIVIILILIFIVTIIIIILIILILRVRRIYGPQITSWYCYDCPSYRTGKIFKKQPEQIYKDLKFTIPPPPK